MSVIVSPAVATVDDAEVVSIVLDFLASRPGAQRMAERWRAGQTLRVVRREPYRTGTAKILPLQSCLPRVPSSDAPPRAPRLGLLDAPNRVASVELSGQSALEGST
ncbi:MAG: hypothetical protein HY334_01740 [Armatimonadetes bacterium]|nr:hypothetical protein [Armatimonadota bacterium]